MEKVEFGTRWNYNGSSELSLGDCIKIANELLKQGQGSYIRELTARRLRQMVQRNFEHFGV